MKHCKGICGVTVLAVLTCMFVFLAYGVADAADPWKRCKANYIESYTESADVTHAKCSEACERIFKGKKYDIAACKQGCDMMNDCFLSKRDEVAKRVCSSGECYSTCLEEMNFLIMGCGVAGQPFCKGKTSSELIPCTTGYEYYGVSMYRKAMEICPKACPK
ncbi:MAG: hypothetical protein JRJ69_10865 [Deltaproteobacteria bacterium]|nr:hypothetical protein [Deltaproteobacteria bacterium]MBW1738027.1 hypothetical protein [Deltaproteobacteria bacterium]MBW1908286.1 hypothetical protein [Deltaproteobacteria bacterium]MBW2033232.1 hypothetical protein [Deltaproteobacteria bacterium]MBW2113277.1 hypothetical protein [Deltaproteobacteria bacterium]